MTMSVSTKDRIAYMMIVAMRMVNMNGGLGVNNHWVSQLGGMLMMLKAMDMDYDLLYDDGKYTKLVLGTTMYDV